MSVTLAQVALPGVTNMFELVMIFAGVLVLVYLLYAFIKSGGDISPYVGMPSLSLLGFMALLVIGGNFVTLATLPTLVASLLAFVVEITTSIFIWPFLIVGLIAHGMRIFQMVSKGVMRKS